MRALTAELAADEEQCQHVPGPKRDRDTPNEGGSGGGTGLQSPVPKLKFKKHRFVHMMVSNFFTIYPSATLS